MANGESKKKHTILFLDDEPAILESLQIAFEDNYEIFTAERGEDALRILPDHPVSLIIADQQMPGMNGVEFLKRSIAICPHAVRVILTGHADIEAAISAINDGRVTSYITKPWEPDELKEHVRLAIEKYDLVMENLELTGALQVANEMLKRENVTLRRGLNEKGRFEGIIGASDAWREVLEVVEQIAPTSTRVLILGANGTGKELIAHAIHANSTRADQPFVDVNCAALPADLLEDQLFGHKKGAYTHAVSDRAGLFEAADKGTLFLDEIGDMSRGLQAKLLRVLNEGTFQRVGEDFNRRVDVRVISATNRDLEQMMKDNEFREDLFFRLNVVQIKIPKIVDRREDIPLLVAHFIKKHCKRHFPDNSKRITGIEKNALGALMAHPLPGNVRQLEHAVERAVVFAKGDRITLANLPPEFGEIGTFNPVSGIRTPHDHQSLREEKDRVKALVEKRFLHYGLSETKGNVTEAAKLTGMNRSLMQQMISKHGIEIRDYKDS